MLPRDLQLTSYALFSLIVAGTVGYRVIEGWSWLDSLWMVSITLTTIGFGEIHPLSTGGRIFTLGLVYAGVGIGGYGVARMTTFIVSGEFTAAVQRRQRERRMEVLQNHFVVVGMGRLGREVAEDLVQRGETVVVIDIDPNVEAEAAAIGAIGIRGDGSSDHVLHAAGLKQAKGLAVATPSAAVNVFVTLSARGIRPDLYIVTRIDDHEAADKAIRAGADEVVSPFRSGGSRIARTLKARHAAEFVERVLSRDFGELEIDEVQMGPKSSLSGRLGRLELKQRFGIVVVALRDPQGTLSSMPSDEANVETGTVLIVLGRPEAIRTLKAQANGR